MDITTREIVTKTKKTQILKCFAEIHNKRTNADHELK